MQDGYVKLDGKRRISIGQYTELDPGEYFRITREEVGGPITLTPAALK